MSEYQTTVEVATPKGWVEKDVTDELLITDIGGDMDRVAAQISYYGAQAGSATELVSKLDGQFKSWKANTAQEILKAEPKMAEWKTKAIVEGRDEYITFVNKIAAAQRNADALWSVYAGFKAKANMLQSRGAMARDEMGAMGMTTPAKKPVKAPVKAPVKQKV
jgi:hypothetical protein